jgi:hypothetical protein
MIYHADELVILACHLGVDPGRVYLVLLDHGRHVAFVHDAVVFDVLINPEVLVRR